MGKMFGFVCGFGPGVERNYSRKRCELRMVRAAKLRAETTKAKKVDDLIDDIQNKRMGRGYVFYGERKSSADAEEENRYFEGEVGTKANSVLVTGATGEVGSWIVLALINAGFNVRILTRRADDAETMFGLDGSNVDVFVGDLNNDADVKEAVDGSVAVVCASGSRNPVGSNSYRAVDFEGVQRLVRCAEESLVKKFVLISCNRNNGFLGTASKWKRQGEDCVSSSNISHSILRLAKTESEPGNAKGITTEASENQAGSISREDVALVITNLLLTEAGYIFDEGVIEGPTTDQPVLKNFTAPLYNTNSVLDPGAQEEEDIFQKFMA
uniref:NAD(P)-binding domain-containing protein n=2 Tax=Rhodosorus marinus TaxID=101924 RepID=A0A7S3E9W6_9RHOD|mmetsp:Transcript_16923/g.69092  ORF Transcript_16923/g.69092 Transcript_16923/m.69092 type:complete len:326 (+) Transcript_16923:113-1090(+)